MCDIGRDLLEARQQVLDPAQHRVDVGRETIEFVTTLGDRKPKVKTTVNNAPRRSRDLIYSARRADGDDKATDKCEKARHERAP